MKEINNYKNMLSKSFIDWSTKYHFRFLFFNIFIIFLFLLRSAGYFQPYFPISVNFIIIAALILSVPLLNVTSRSVFFATFCFWIFAGFLKLVKIDVWAERTGIYTYQFLFFGVLLLIFENIKNFSSRKQ